MKNTVSSIHAFQFNWCQKWVLSCAAGVTKVVSPEQKKTDPRRNQLKPSEGEQNKKKTSRRESTKSICRMPFTVYNLSIWLSKKYTTEFEKIAHKISNIKWLILNTNQYFQNILIKKSKQNPDFDIQTKNINVFKHFSYYFVDFFSLSLSFLISSSCCDVWFGTPSEPN